MQDLLFETVSRVIGILWLLQLSGCLVGPDYLKPKSATPEQFTGSVESGFNSADVDDVWWKTFGDARLATLIQEAITENRDVAVALARLNESRALRRESALQLTPSVQASADYVSQKIRNTQGSFLPGEDRTFESYEAGFDAQWELDFFGRLRRSLEANTAERDAAEANLSDVQRTVAADVARSYMELRGLQEQLRVAEHNAELQVETLRLVELRTSAGASSDLDVARSRSQLGITKAGIPSLQSAVKSAIFRIGVLTGRTPATFLEELSAPAQLPEYQGPVALSSPAELLRRRPDIRIAERKLAAETARVGISEADLYPRVTLVGSLGIGSRSAADLFESGNDTYAFGPSITWAAFDIVRVKARIDAADARTQAALASYEQAILRALEDVESAVAKVADERKRQAHLTDAAAQAARAVSLAAIQFRVGSIDLLTVLDVERVQLLAQGDLARSRTDLSVAMVTLFKALGGGWDNPNLEQKPA